jgi:glycogen debranching enzyme
MGAPPDALDAAFAPLRDLTHPDPRVPLLVSGRSGCAILSGSGEFAYSCETRGTTMDWAGVYGQGVRLSGPWLLRVETPRGVHTLPESLERLTAHRTHVESVHRTPDLRIRHSVVPLDALPGVTRRLEFTAPGGAPVPVRVLSDLVPFLAPVMMEGIKPYDYRVRAHRGRVEVRSHGYGLALESDPAATGVTLDGASALGRRRGHEVRHLGFEQRLTVPPNRSVAATSVLWGGLERTVAARPGAGRAELARAPTAPRAAEATFRAWVEATPRLAFPDDPQLERAYGLARGALRALYYAPEGDLTGLVAGYPWYGALWCRDLAWMLPAVTWMGDFDWAERSLRSVFRFQAPSRVPILAAEEGELPMQISPGPIFLYGTSDTTLYYPSIVRRLFAHSGDLAFARELYPRLERVANWARAKVHDRTGLIVNGGEIQAMREASTGLGRVQYGFEAPDTTIWDSTDRRDHAIDIQVLWFEALESLAEITSRLGAPPSGSGYPVQAQAVRTTICERFRWPDERYLYDSLRTDGTPVPKIRPNALRAVSAGVLTGEDARAAVRRAAESDLTTDWGLRTLSARDLSYDPIAYHDGRVWPIATAWAADAAFAADEPELGGGYLRTVSAGFEREAGLAHECYRGDRLEPYDSCFLLGFSVAPFVTTLFDRLWGLRPYLERGAVAIAPRFPASWTRAAADRIRLGTGALSLRYAPGEVRARWSGLEPLELEGEVERATIPPEGERRLALPRLATAS